MLEDEEKRTLKFLVILILSIVFFGIIIGISTYERYEVRKVQRCVEVVGTKYYQKTLFWSKSVPEEYLVLADGREVPKEDAWTYMEFKVEITDKMTLLTKSKGQYCDYVYERTKPNVSFQELKTPR